MISSSIRSSSSETEAIGACTEVWVEREPQPSARGRLHRCRNPPPLFHPRQCHPVRLTPPHPQSDCQPNGWRRASVFVVFGFCCVAHRFNRFGTSNPEKSLSSELDTVGVASSSEIDVEALSPALVRVLARVLACSMRPATDSMGRPALKLSTRLGIL